MQNVTFFVEYHLLYSLQRGPVGIIVLQTSLDSSILFSGSPWLSHLWLRANPFGERLLHPQFGEISLSNLPQSLLKIYSTAQ